MTALRGWRAVLAPVLLASSAIAAPQASVAGTAAPIDVAKSLYAAFERGDLDALQSLLAPDVLWTLHGPVDEIPYAGDYRGPEGVRQFFTDVGGGLRVTEFRPDSFATEGDRVYVRGTEKGEVHATGGRYELVWAQIFTVRDGRITRFEEITDSAAIAAAFAPADPARGRAYFTTCAGCHSPDGRGNRYMNAPNLTGIDAAYLVRQLRHFSALVRGGTSDFYGWQMNGRAKAMPSDRAIRDVVAYVGTLPVVKPVVTLKGNATRGQALYATCAACHGAKAEGNPALGAPALALLDDWYQVRQLQGYRTGGRGTHASDTPGQQMRAAMMVLRDDRALTDVVAYVTSLAPAD